ncbi:MAG: hypothetical protein J5831_03585 [Bacteroidales bacterium]|nr:hypothetical protein [Bacteroidales bacterium]
MKKIVRTVWISMLTGLAFLVACTGPGRLTRAEKKQLKNERTEIVAKLQAYQKEWRVDAENHLMGIGPSIVLDKDKYKAIRELYQDRQEEQALLERLLDIDQALKDNKAAQNSEQRLGDVRERTLLLRDAIQNAEPPRLYGPPPISDRQRSLDSLRKAQSREPAELLYGPPVTPKNDRLSNQELDDKIGQLQTQLDSIGAILQRREGACVYGSPEVIERYRQETERLRSEAQDLQKELMHLKDQRKARQPK